jgi:hypothetical protein
VRLCVGHASACVVQALVCGSQMEERLAAEQSRESPDHDGTTCVVVELPKVDRPDFEKIKSKNFKEMADPRLRTACEGCKRTIHDGGEAIGEVELG